MEANEDEYEPVGEVDDRSHSKLDYSDKSNDNDDGDESLSVSEYPKKKHQVQSPCVSEIKSVRL